jgi:hypothetical protein
MFMGKRLAYAVVAFALAFTVIYQNCSRVEFQEPTVESKVSNSSPTENESGR